MSDQTRCCCGTAQKKVLLYACSGAANVAEIADHAARRLTAEKVGSMFCLAGLGAEIPNMVQTARDADVNLVLDGCPMDCARKIFEKLRLANVKVVRVTDHGIEKAKGVKITDQQVEKIVAQAKAALATA